MAMSTQEAEVQLGALAHEIEGSERAIASWEEALVSAEERDDKDEVRRLSQEIDGARRNVRIANEQMSIISGSARSKRERGPSR
jgi:hypothetical protein